MEYIGNYLGYQVYRNSEGQLEGYKSRGKRIQIDDSTFTFSDLDRVVTNQSTMEGFIDFINGKKPKTKTVKIKDLPSLF